MIVPLNMISNFPTKKTYNPGGLRSFQFIPSNSVTYAPPITAGAITVPFSFSTGALMLTGYSTGETLDFKESLKDSDNGSQFVQELSGFVPGDQTELIGLMQQMLGLPFTLLFTDARGQSRVAGSHGFPLIFTADFSSGSGRSDAKGYQFKFSGESIYSAPAYII